MKCTTDGSDEGQQRQVDIPQSISTQIILLTVLRSLSSEEQLRKALTEFAEVPYTS